MASTLRPEAALADLEHARRSHAHASAALREAVLDARVAGCTWSEIADILQVTRQAAAAKYSLDDPQLRIVKAWIQIEALVQRAARRKETFDQTVGRLGDAGMFHPADLNQILHIRELRNSAVHARRAITVAEAEQIADWLIPLSGNLYSGSTGDSRT